jgi:ubiquinone/menaquinone biosynthesis C-methylase UbiE
VARDLAAYFVKVYATDSSMKQLEHAPAAANVQYSQAPAEKTSFPDSMFDLITVGQAIHWFNIQEFYKEAIRVARPGAVLAVWGYSLLSVNPRIDEMVLDFYTKIIGPYWDPERRLIDEHYRTIPFPFEEIQSPGFSFSFDWTLAELHGYLTTWSAVQKYIKANGANPVNALVEKIRPFWVKERMTVTFPLFLRCGRI